MQSLTSLLTTYTATSDNQTLFSIRAQDTTECPPTDIIIVLDRSASMDMPCIIFDEDGNQHENGFTRLDLAKHAL